MADSAKSEAKKESFWKGVKTEFKKIAWPDRKETVKQSVAVLCVSVVLGLIITFLDTLIQFGINFLTSIGI
ncbi:MAG: preprotein translocase subunit SecE [Lachnospiraceae bacterium]|jgi:preprotein translocase subunit SecE|nr:preprotein translocase subunit SecE [Lachnospiraceae bacterium]